MSSSTAVIKPRNAGGADVPRPHEPQGGLMVARLMRYMVGASSAEVVAAILRVSFPDARTALDLTPGYGCFWSEAVPTHFSVFFSDHDFTALPYAEASYDVPIFDPPHLGAGGQNGIMASRYGTFKDREVEPTIRAG